MLPFEKFGKDLRMKHEYCCKSWHVFTFNGKCRYVLHNFIWQVLQLTYERNWLCMNMDLLDWSDNASPQCCHSFYKIYKKNRNSEAVLKKNLRIMVITEVIWGKTVPLFPQPSAFRYKREPCNNTSCNHLSKYSNDALSRYIILLHCYFASSCIEDRTKIH